MQFGAETVAEAGNVCLIGPTGGGKTSLVATFRQALARNLHGFDAATRFAVVPADLAEAKRRGADHALFDAYARSSFEERERAFLEQWQGRAGGAGDAPAHQSTREATETFVFTTTRYRAAPMPPDERVVTVTDTGGELMGDMLGLDFKRLAAAEDALPEGARATIDALRTYLAAVARSEALVVPLPLVGYQDAVWSSALLRLTAALYEQPEVRLRRLVIAWTRYELLLSDYGELAVELAARPDVAAEAVRAALRGYVQARHFLETLAVTAAGRGQPIEILHLPVSAHGFLARSGAANVRFFDDPRRYHGRNATGLAGVADAWRPFLAADPILLAIYGAEGHHLALPQAALAGGAAPPPEPAAPVPEPRRGFPGLGLFGGRS